MAAFVRRIARARQEGTDSSVGLANSSLVKYIGDGAASSELNYAPTNSASSRPTYRVTAYSKGGDSATEAVLESVFICPGGCFTAADLSQYGG